MGLAVQPLPLPSLKYAERAGGVQYMTNMALAVKETSSSKKAGLSVAFLDILPASFKPKPISWYRVAVLPASIVALLIVAFMVTTIQNASANTDGLRSQLATQTTLLTQKTALNKKLTDSNAQLKKDVTTAQTTSDAFNKAVVSLKASSNTANDQLDTTVNAVTSDVTITTISYSGKDFTLTGKAKNEAVFRTLVGTLNDSQQFADVTVTSVTQNADGTETFTVTLKTGGN